MRGQLRPYYCELYITYDRTLTRHLNALLYTQMYYINVTSSLPNMAKNNPELNINNSIIFLYCII